jgi:PAS domain S-box-containing protein
MRITAVNQATLDFYGAGDLAELVQNMLTTLTDQGMESFKNALVNLAEDRPLYEGKISQRTLSGEMRHVSMRVFANPAEAIPFSRVIVAMVDISEQMKSEAALRESEQKFRAIAEQLRDVITLTDAAGVIQYISPACRRLFDTAPEEMVGRHFVEFLDEASVPVALAGFQQAMTAGEKAMNLELRMKRGDGSTFLAELDGTMAVIGAVPCSLAVIRDVADVNARRGKCGA